MFLPDQYQALDFGEGRRLEQFGELILDRPCPAAEFMKKKSPSLWPKADAVFQVDEISSKKSNVFVKRGSWYAKTVLGQSFFSKNVEKSNVNSTTWQIFRDQAVFELRGTPFGHVGVFPEQEENWDKIKLFCQGQTQTNQTPVESDGHCAALRSRQPFRVLNLFAYTGGSTLAATQGGAEVVHVDAAKNVVGWARKNAEISQIAGSQIHWIAEDARKFVRRELKRGKNYRGIILDPPSYGHGAKGEVWRLTKHLPGLLFDCFALLESVLPCFVLLTCHTPGFSLQRLANLVEATAKDAFGGKFSRIQMHLDAQTLLLRAESGATLPSGESVMFCSNDK